MPIKRCITFVHRSRSASRPTSSSSASPRAPSLRRRHAGAQHARRRRSAPVVAKTSSAKSSPGRRTRRSISATNGAVKPARVCSSASAKRQLTDVEVRAPRRQGRALRASARKASSLASSLPAASPAPSAPRPRASCSARTASPSTSRATALPKVELERATLVVPRQGRPRRGKDAVALGQQVGEAVCIARDLINEPPNELYPEALADARRERMQGARPQGARCSTRPRSRSKGMKLIVAVGQGSAASRASST